MNVEYKLTASRKWLEVTPAAPLHTNRVIVTFPDGKARDFALEFGGCTLDIASRQHPVVLPVTIPERAPVNIRFDTAEIPVSVVLSND